MIFLCKNILAKGKGERGNIKHGSDQRDTKSSCAGGHPTRTANHVGMTCPQVSGPIGYIHNWAPFYLPFVRFLLRKCKTWSCLATIGWCHRFFLHLLFVFEIQQICSNCERFIFLKFDWCLTIHAHIQTTTDSCVSRLSLADGCTVNAPRLLLDWAEFGEPISLLLAKCSGTSFADLTVLENMWIQHEYEEGSEYRDIVFIVFPLPVLLRQCSVCNFSGVRVSFLKEHHVRPQRNTTNDK